MKHQPSLFKTSIQLTLDGGDWESYLIQEVCKALWRLAYMFVLEINSYVFGCCCPKNSIFLNLTGFHRPVHSHVASAEFLAELYLHLVICPCMGLSFDSAHFVWLQVPPQITDMQSIKPCQKALQQRFWPETHPMTWNPDRSELDCPLIPHITNPLELSWCSTNKVSMRYKSNCYMLSRPCFVPAGQQHGWAHI